MLRGCKGWCIQGVLFSISCTTCHALAHAPGLPLRNNQALNGYTTKLSAVLAPLADTKAVMCAYGSQLPLMMTGIVGCVGTVTPKTRKAIIDLMLLLAKTHKWKDGRSRRVPSAYVSHVRKASVQRTMKDITQ